MTMRGHSGSKPRTPRDVRCCAVYKVCVFVLTPKKVTRVLLSLAFFIFFCNQGASCQTRGRERALGGSGTGTRKTGLKQGSTQSCDVC